MSPPLDDQGAVPLEAGDEDRRHLTLPGGLPGQTVQDRVLFIEFWQREIERRLGEGVKQFGEIKIAVNDLQQAVRPKPLSVMKFLPVLVVGTLSLLGFVWAAARYPDRHEFDTKINTVQTDVAAMRLEQAQITGKLDMLLRGAKP
jgi:hypothetical protein